MFLTPELLCNLTDRKAIPAQIEWLRANHYVFDVSAAGRPRVLTEYVRRRLGGTDEQAVETVKKSEPVFDFLQRNR